MPFLQVTVLGSILYCVPNPKLIFRQRTFCTLQVLYFFIYIYANLYLSIYKLHIYIYIKLQKKFPYSPHFKAAYREQP